MKLVVKFITREFSDVNASGVQTSWASTLAAAR
jgi:hypothetical protein